MKHGSNIGLVSILILVILSGVALAWLNVSYQSPASGSSQKLNIYDTFGVSVNVTCVGEYCGNVLGTLKFNDTNGLTPNRIVDVSYGVPFYAYLNETVFGISDDNNIRCMDVGDANNDGKNDTVVGRSSTSGINRKIYINQSGGWTAYSISGDYLAEARSVAIGDADNDDLNEVVFGLNMSSYGNALRMYKNTSGTWVETNISDVPSSVWSVAIGDANNDGKNEIIIGMASTANETRMYNYTGGSWKETNISDTPTSITRVKVGDADGDGLNEVFVGMTNTDNETRMYKNVSGGWNETNIGDSTGSVYGFDIGDANNDGSSELVVGVDSGINKLRTYNYTGGKWVESNISSGLPSIAIYGLSVGDVNNDGINEIVIGSSSTASTKDLRMYVNSSGRWNEYNLSQIASVTHWVYSIQVKDVNNDGKNEVVVATYATGTVTNDVRYSTVVTNPAGCGPLSSGQTCRIAWLVNATKTSNAQYWLNVTVNSTDGSVSSNSSGNFQINITRPWLNVTYQSPASGSSQNVNQSNTFNVTMNVTCNDFDCGLVWGTIRYNASGTSPNSNVSRVWGDAPLYIKSGFGPQTLFSETAINPPSSSISMVKVGDADNDGKNEIIAVGQLSGNINVRMYKNNTPLPNASTHWAETNISASLPPISTYSVAIGDANNDLKNEVVIGIDNTTGGGTAYELRMYENKSGNWTETNISDLTNGTGAIDIGDVNNDGLNEIVAVMDCGSATCARNNTRIYNFTGGSWVETNISSGRIPLSAVAIGDANNDEKIDIVVGAFRYSPYIQIYENKSGGWVETNISSSGVFSVRIADANNDGLNEIVAAGASGFRILNFTGGSWVETIIRSLTGSRADVGDVNNDGANDIVATTSSDFRMYENKSGKWVESNISISSGSPDYVTSGDADNDNVIEVVGSTGANNNDLRIYENLKQTLSCGYLYLDQTCTITWIVNATGPVGTQYWLDVNFSSVGNRSEGNDSGDFQINITSGAPADSTAPNIDNFKYNVTNMTNYSFAQGYQFNATISDAGVGVDKVWIEHNFTGTMTNNTVLQHNGNEYYYDYGRMAAGFYYIKWWANDTSGNTNSSDYVKYYQINRSYLPMTLYINGTDGDKTLYNNSVANFTANFTTGYPFNITLWTNLTGTMAFWYNQSSPLTNYTELSPYQARNYTILANWTGNQNYTYGQANHSLTLQYGYGWLNVSYQSPANGSSQNVFQYNTFNIKMDINCVGGTCGFVNGTLRYNGSAGLNPGTHVSNITGSTPFYVLSQALETNISDVPTYVMSVAIGDANNDGKNEMVVGILSSTNEVRMYENKSGTWVETIIKTLSTNVYSVAIGDANNDGLNEVVVGMSTVLTPLRMYQNKSGGWVETIISAPAWSSPGSVAIGDANNDGLNEVVIGLQGGSNHTRMYQNTSGKWVETNISNPGALYSVKIGDANNDGKNEVVVGLWGGTNSTRMYENKSGAWVETNISNMPAATVYSVAIGDADNDGQNEVVSGGGTTNEVTMYKNKTGTWVEMNISNEPNSVYSVAIGDADNDGQKEVVIGMMSTTNEVRMYENKSEAWIETNISDLPTTVRSVAIGDANNDGSNDVVVGMETTTNEVRIYTLGSNPFSCGYLTQGQTYTMFWIINTTGSPGTQYWLDANFTSSLSQVPANDSGDFQLNITNRHGWLNVSYQSPANGSSQNVSQYSTFNVSMNVTCVGGVECENVFGVLRYNSSSQNPDTNVSIVQGTNPFYIKYTDSPSHSFVETNISELDGLDTEINSVAIGDANNDGKNDVVVGLGYGDNKLRMFENKSGSWVETYIGNLYGDFDYVYSVVIGDANNDLKNEVVIGANYGTSLIKMYENKSGGWVETNISNLDYWQYSDWVYSVAIGDANNDGKNEVVAGLGSTKNETRMYENKSGGWVETNISDEPIAVQSVAIGDANNDGIKEVVIGMSSTTNGIRMYQNTSGKWVETNISNVPTTVYSVAIGDADNDGLNEVAIGMAKYVPNQIRTYKNTTGRWVETNISNESEKVNSVAIGDADNDGKNEIAIVMDATTNPIRMYENKSEAWIETNISDADYDVYTVAIGDADNDGQNEVAIGTSYDYEARIYQNVNSPSSCGYLYTGQICTLSWEVNATGFLGHWLDANFTSSDSEIAANDSGNFQINITGVDNIAPNIAGWAFNVSNMTNYSSSQRYQFNATVTDYSVISYVWVEQNFSGTMTNTTVGSCGGNVYCYNVSSLGAGFYYMKWYANDSSANHNLNNSDWVHYYQVNKSYLPITLYINGVNGDKTLENSSVANFTANLSASYGFNITLYTNLSRNIILSEYEGFEGAFLPSGWLTGGNANWHQNSTNPIKGTYSAASGGIGFDQMTWINVTKTYLVDGNISFNWSVSSEQYYDYLCFCMDKGCGQTGCTCVEEDGTADAKICSSEDGVWTNGSVTRAVPAGTHDFTWCYAEDWAYSPGADMGKIDDIDFNGTAIGLTLWDAQNSPLTNYTNLSPYAAGNYIILASLATQNYTGQANHSLNLTAAAPSYSWLNVSYQSPAAGNSQNASQNNPFNVTVNVTCVGGTCGNVYGWLRYNGSSQNPDTNVNITAGAIPFYIMYGNASPQVFAETLIGDEPSSVRSLAVGDANNDGKNEIVIGLAIYEKGVRMYENISGGWVETTNISQRTTGPTYVAISIGDANNDGKNDVVVGSTIVISAVQMYQNTTGTWAETDISSMNDAVYAVPVGDANNDGSNEIVAAAGSGEYYGLSIFNYTGGSWIRTNISNVSTTIFSAVIGDADNDEQNEIVVGLMNGANKLRMYKNTSGTWVETNISDEPNWTRSVYIGDADNDGQNEIVAGIYDCTNELRMYKNTSGTWVETNISDEPTNVQAVTIGDVDNDGKNEVVAGLTATTTGLREYKNASGGWIEKNISSPPTLVYSVTVADAYKNGNKELFVSLFNTSYEIRMYDYPLNPLTCGAMSSGQTCQLSWTVNATGTPSTQYWLDANFTSSYSQVPANDSGNFQINITSGAVAAGCAISTPTVLSANMNCPGGLNITNPGILTTNGWNVTVGGNIFVEGGLNASGTASIVNSTGQLIVSSNANVTQGTGLFNFSGGYLQNGTNSTFIQGGNVYVGGNFNMTNGTFTGSISYVLTCSGNFTVASGGVMTLYVLTLNMTGSNTFVSFPSSPEMHGLIISGTVTLPSTSAVVVLGISGGSGITGGLIVGPSAVFTMNKDIIFYSHHGGVITNNGYINGSGTLGWYAYDATPRNFAPGNITCPVRVTSFGSQIANSVFNLIGNTNLGSTLLVDSATGYNVTLNHSSNYPLTVNGLMTLGAYGIMTQGTGAWNFSGGYLQNGANSIFTQGGNIFVSNFNVTNGIFTASNSYNISLIGNFSTLSANWAQWQGNLVFLRNASMYTDNYAWVYSIIAYNNVTLTGRTLVSNGFNLTAGNIWTQGANSLLYMFGSAITTMNNQGTISGGTLGFDDVVANRNISPNLGTLNCNILMDTGNINANFNLTMSSNISITGNFNIYASSTGNISLSHGNNYAFTVGGLSTIGLNASVTQGTGLWNFSGGYLQNGANSVFTQGGNVFVNGNTNISVGTLTGNSGYNWTSAGNFTVETSGSVAAGAAFRLVMTTDETNITSNSGISNLDGYSLTVNGNVTLSGTRTTDFQVGLTIASGKKLTLKRELVLFNTAIANINNLGTIDGTGLLSFQLYNSDRNFGTLGTITSPVEIIEREDASGSRILNLSANTVFGSTLNVYSSHTTYNATLYHGSNYALNVSGLTTVGNRGIMTQGTGTWTFNGLTLNGANATYNGNGNLTLSGGSINITQLGYLNNVTLNGTKFSLNGSSVSVRRLVSIPPDSATTINISRYVNISNLGSGVMDLNVSYVDSGLPCSESDMRMYVNNGSSWNQINSSVDTSRDTVYSTNVSSFGLFAPMCVIQGCSITTPTVLTANMNCPGGLNITNPGILNTNGWNVTVGGNIFVEGRLNASGTASIVNATGQIVLSSNANVTQGTGQFNFSGGHLQNGSNSTFTQGGNVYVNGNFNLTAGTFIGPSSSSMLSADNFTQNGGNATINAGNLNITTDVIINGTFSAGSGTISVGRNWNSTYSDFHKETASVYLLGTGTLQVNYGWGGGEYPFWNISLAYPTKTTTMVSGFYSFNLYLNNGTLVMGNNQIYSYGDYIEPRSHIYGNGTITSTGGYLHLRVGGDYGRWNNTIWVPYLSIEGINLGTDENRTLNMTSNMNVLNVLQIVGYNAHEQILRTGGYNISTGDLSIGDTAIGHAWILANNNERINVSGNLDIYNGSKIEATTAIVNVSKNTTIKSGGALIGSANLNNLTIESGAGVRVSGDGMLTLYGNLTLGGDLNVTQGTLVNITLNGTKFSLNGSNVAVRNLLYTPPDSVNINISKYVNITDLGSGMMNLNISYVGAALGCSETELSMYRYDGANWNILASTGIDAARDIVYGNSISAFGVFAPMCSKYGWLNVSYQSPVAGSSQEVGQGTTFTVNMDVKCIGWDCGNVIGTLRYNASNGLNPDTNISDVLGATPFYASTNSVETIIKDESTSVYSAAVGDANNDGKQDVVMVSPFSPGTRMYENKTGTWVETIINASGGYSMAVGDANNDGQNEVVVGTSAKLTMYQNMSGGWVEMNISNVPTVVNSIAIGDANNDGIKEVVIGMSSTTNGTRMYQNTSGKWVETNISDVPSTVYSVAIGDANNDGKNDVVIGMSSPIVNEVRMYENKSGGWVETNISDVPVRVYSVAIGDANNDLKNEVVIGLWQTTPNRLRMYENKTGTWVETNISVGDADSYYYSIKSVAIGDANNDGQNDVVIGINNLNNSKKLRMYENKSGGWIETNVSDTPNNIKSVAIGNANNDGKNEIIIGMDDTMGELRMYEINANPPSCGYLAQDQTCHVVWIVNVTGTPGTRYWLDANFSSKSSMGPSNDSGDFQINILPHYGWLNVSYQSPANGSSQNVTQYSNFNVSLNVTCVGGGTCGNVAGVLRYNASSGLNPDTNVSAIIGAVPFCAQTGEPASFAETNIKDFDGVTVKVVAIGDANNDGKDDVVISVVWDNVIRMYENKSGGWVETNISSMYYPNYVNSVAIGDADNDGQNEVVIGGYDDNQTRMYKNTTGTWVETNIGDLGYYEWDVYSVAIGDADNDGKNEVVIGWGGFGEMSNEVRMYENKSGGWVETNISDEDSDVLSVAIGDADNDGKNEVAIGGYFSNGVKIYENESDDWIGTNISDDVNVWGESVAIGDANNDGLNEVIFGMEETTYRVMMYENKSGGWQETNISLEPEAVYSVAIGDADNDGKNEVAIGIDSGYTLKTENEVRMYENKSGGWIETNISDVDSDVLSVAIGDADNDGKNDVVIGLSYDNNEVRMYSLISNPLSCSLSLGQTCAMGWMVNATGSGRYWLDTNFTSSYSSVPANDSGNFQVNITTPQLGITLVSPSLSSTIFRYRTFDINVTVTCLGGAHCNDVMGYASYNLTSNTVPNVKINTTVGDVPFYNFSGANPYSCPNLTEGQSCNYSIRVNATGEFQSEWLLNVTFNSTQLGLPSSSTPNFKLVITPITGCMDFINCNYPNCLYYVDEVITIESADAQHKVGSHIRRCWS